MFGLEGQELGQVIGGVLILVFGVAAGGGGLRAWMRRRDEPDGSTSREEILRQNLHDQRHAETMRILADVARSTNSAAQASRSAAEAAARSADMTERLAGTLERHLRKCEGGTGPRAVASNGGDRRPS